METITSLLKKSRRGCNGMLTLYHKHDVSSSHLKAVQPVCHSINERQTFPWLVTVFSVVHCFLGEKCMCYYLCLTYMWNHFNFHHKQTIWENFDRWMVVKIWEGLPCLHRQNLATSSTPVPPMPPTHGPEGEHC